MARAGLTDHPKFCRLVYLLKEPVPHVWGYLECLWKSAYQRRSDIIGDEIDVELAAMYPGEQGKFVKSVVAAGFVDIREGRHFVHDLIDHAPPYVRRGLLKRANGEPEDDSESTNGKPQVDLKSTSGRPEVDHESTNGRPLADKENREEKRIEKRNTYGVDFEVFWKAYPRKQAKEVAEKAWKKLKPDAALIAVIMKNITTRRDWIEKPDYVPHGSTYLNGKRWQDEDTNGVPQPQKQPAMDLNRVLGYETDE